jgi:spermidine synthase
VFIDAYSNLLSFPEHLVTREFFEQVRKTLNPDAAVVINAIQTPNFADKFSIRFDNTLRSVFSHVNRDLIETYDGWQKNLKHTNVMYVAYDRTPGLNEIYTDNKNTSYRDKKPAWQTGALP